MSNPELVAEFIMRCFHARTAAHVLHLKSKSWVEHVILREFYEKIVDLVDEFAEMFQGQYGDIIKDYPDGYRTPPNALSLINGLRTWIDTNRDKMCDSRQGQAQIDVIMMLLDSTAYKLKLLN